MNTTFGGGHDCHVDCMAVAQLEVHSHCRNFFMQPSNWTRGSYFTYAKNEKWLSKKHKKKTFINNLPQILKVLLLASQLFLQ